MQYNKLVHISISIGLRIHFFIETLITINNHLFDIYISFKCFKQLVLVCESLATVADHVQVYLQKVFFKLDGFLFPRASSFYVNSMYRLSY